MKKSRKIVSLLLTAVVMSTMGTSYRPEIVSATTVSYEESTKSVSSVVKLIEGNSNWKYEDGDKSLYYNKETDFRSKSFDDLTWKTGIGPFGYPADDEGDFGSISKGTLINKTNGKDENSIITYYFRKNFSVKDASKIGKLTAKLFADDGYVMYINGSEVSRNSMPEGSINHESLASGTAKYVEVDLSNYTSILTEGENTIAISVHNNAKTSSDIYFDMELEAMYNDENQKPKQVNAHLGDDASTSINLTYTTITESATKAVVNKVGDSKLLTFEGTNSIGNANKYFHLIQVTGLEANSEYEYVVGEGANTFKGTFKTAPAKGSKDSFKFVYLADTQVNNSTDAKALGATLQKVSESDADFVYLAGDVTNTSTSENQWELLFNNSGTFSDGGQNMFGNKSIAVIQGNHDNNTMTRHINAPAQEGNIVYSYDYGPAKFIMINLETARYDATARDKQLAFVKAKVAEAKANGQWTVVGFHKSLYTGASHVSDSDVVEARKYWGPTLANLDVDLVLQGHDHVYSRGFINADGKNANPTSINEKTVEDPKNAPLWMVGGHAGGLKWYSRKNYSVNPGDPIAPNYEFLDVNSTDDQSDSKKEQWIVEIEMSNDKFTLNTYAFKYDTNTDKITTEKYLYDTLTTERNITSADVSGSEIGVVDNNDEVTYTASLSKIKDTNAFNMEVEYDENALEFVKAESLVDGTIFTDIKNENGKASIIVGSEKLITSTGKVDVAKFTFKMKSGVNAGETKVVLRKADSAQAIVEDGKVTGAFDSLSEFNTNEVTTEIYTYANASDINKDGRITLADLSIALGNYQGNIRKFDINLDGVINAKDFIIIINKMTR